VVLLFVFLFGRVLPCEAEGLPIPKGAKEFRYLSEDPKERRAFLESQKELLQEILKDLAKLKPQKPEEQKALREAEELLKSLPLLWQKIELEFEQKETTGFNLPPPPKKEAKLADFQKLLLLGFQLRHEIETLKGKQQIEEDELDRLEKALEEIYRDYLLLAEKGPSAQAYLKLAELLNLQARWALAKLELKRTTARLEFLSELENKWQETLEKTFAKLKVRPEEVAALQKEFEKIQEKLENIKKTNQKKREAIERELALIEIRLTKLGGKDSQTYKRLYYETRKEAYETLLEILEAQESLVALEGEEKRLWRDFAACLAKCSRKHVAQSLEEHENRLQKLENQQESLQFRLNYLQEKSILVRSNLSLHQDIARKGVMTSLIQKPFLASLIQEEKNLLASLEKLQELLQKKRETLRRFLFEGKTILFLWKSRLSIWQKAYNKVQKLYQRSEKTFKAVLYYPLWKSGETTFTVLSFLKLILVLTIGIIILKLLRRRLEKFLIKHLGMAPGVVNSLSTLSYYIMLCLLALVALSSAGVNMSQIALIFGALSVGIGFGLQTIANNFISGIILLSERSIKVGDLVQFEDGTIGVVKKINIRSTVIRTFDALEIIVPNSEFISQRISTWTYEDDWRRILIPFGVAYGTDPEKVRDVVIEAARKVPITREDRDHPIRVRFVGFGESSLDFELAVWIRQSEVNRAMTGIKSDYYYAIYKALQEAGIEIPFPQRDIHLRSIYPEALEGLKKLARGDDQCA